MKKLFRKYRKHIWIYIAITSFVFLFFLRVLQFRAAQSGLIYPNTYIGDINFGGKTEDEAAELLNKKIQAILEGGLSVSIKGKNFNFGLLEYGADPDLSRDLIKTNSLNTVEALYAVGRSRFNLAANLMDTMQSISGKNNLSADIEFSDEDLISYLKHNLKDLETPSKNAGIEFRGDEPVIKDETIGSKIDYVDVLKKLKTQLQLLQKPYIAIDLVPDNPEIKKFEVEDRVPEIKQALSRVPFTVKYGEGEWQINKNTLKKYLDFEKQDGVAALAISKEKSAPFFDAVSKAVNVPAQDARFEIKDGRVIEFQTSRLGKTLDAEATRQALNGILFDGFPAVNAIVADSAPEFTTSNANQFGVSELLGVGTSTFAGSPPNRIHNIKTGAEKINGLLVKPGEEFSLLKALGEIDGEHGFKPELVIKENKTVPEFGGGLCQIGTTTFRAALASGLPITERQAHSYRVAYYEPAGTDATIYNPAPDFKFLNDTAGYILIQTKMAGTTLVFEFWGKKDGRESTMTKPVVYNIVPPPPVKYLESATLKPGEKKKVETAHSGADAYFKYTIKYPDERGEVNKTFTSHYRPWAEVWLVGATSTPAQ
ncbi:MAG: VanW family protein [bacterium]